MTSVFDDRMAFVSLARQRYPDFPLPMAVEALVSDRRKAGLGALDERLRRGRARDEGPAYAKWFDNERGFVCYDLQLKRRASTHRLSPFVRRLPFDCSGDETFPVECVPASIVHRRLVVRLPVVDGQPSRLVLAAELRAARREMRAKMRYGTSSKP